MEKISIIGLGWFGLPLAEKLTENQYFIKGSTTSNSKLKKLLEDNIDAYQLMLNEENISGNISDCLAGSDILILNTPPGLRRNPESNYVAKIKNLIPYVEKSSIKKVLYISSTSVFSEATDFPTINNQTTPNATTNAGKQIIGVEKLLQSNKAFKTTILRFSGLVDERRHPVTMMSKRKSIPNANAPTNLIHLKDCIGICLQIIKGNTWGATLNASYPLHPKKIDYYTNQALKKGLDKPDFNLEIESKGKIINGEETSEILNYRYKNTII